VKESILKVKEFHKKFLVPYNNYVTLINKDRYMLRYSLIKEELDEYLEACENKDIVKIADALGDLLYVVYGTIVEHGLQDYIEDVFNEIHRSNMSKLDENGKPIFREDGKVLKGKNYFSPDLKSILFNKKRDKNEKS